MAVSQTDERSRVRKRVRRYALSGTLVTGIGGLLIVVFPAMLESGIQSQMQLREGNEVFESWRDVPLAITVKVHIWHIENADQFANGAKPRLVERGPYYYKSV